MLVKPPTTHQPDLLAQITPTIIRSTNRRRSIMIQIHPEKGVIIRAPKSASNWRIEKFLKEKSEWIKKSLAKISDKKSKIPKYNFIQGEKFPYLGEPTILPVYKRQDVIKWYKERAQEFLAQRTKTFAKILEQKIATRTIIGPTPRQWSGFPPIPPPKILIKSFKSRWGVCGRGNTISYNWKIMTAPIEIIDYLVCHELSHVVHKNHSCRFYKILSLLDPDYKTHQKYLRENSMALTI